MNSLSSSPSSLFTIHSSSSSSSRFNFSIVPSSSSSSSHLRFICRIKTLTNDLPFILHDALDASGIDTHHARVARENFCSQIEKLSEIERHTSISINRKVNLGKTALHIADEDDSLVSHSSVPLPIDSFLGRLDDLAMGFCRMYSSSLKSSPEVFLHNLERYLFVHKGFRRDPVNNISESRALYLHSVLTHRSGSAAMLSLIYSEILKMLRLWSLLSFDAEIHFPLDLVSLPRAFDKLKSKVSDQQHILTSQSLLVEILRNLKQAFWPFQNDPTRSLFLRAASAAKCIDELNVGEESGFERASAKAAQHRLERGVWTTVRLGDMRRALSACERLILLEYDIDELRDYSILLYHCGFYEESQRYLKFYQASAESLVQEETPNALRELENLAVEKLMIRLNLLSMDEGWGKPSINRSSLGKFSEPW